MPALVELIHTLRDNNISALCAEIATKEQSSAIARETGEVEPILVLYLDEFTATEKRALDHDGNWSEKYPATNLVRQTWKRLCESHSLGDGHYSDQMFVFIRNAQATRLERLIRESKEAVVTAMLRTLPSPKYVFASSEPGYSIFFESPAELKTEQKNGSLVRRRAEIQAILKGRDRFNCFDPEAVEIRFLDAVTRAHDLYGLARED